MSKVIQHNFGATYQEGIVSQVDSTTHKIKVTIPALEDLESAWLPYLALNAGGNQFYCLPDVGELVAVLFDAYGEGGCVLGAIYNKQDTPPAQDSNIWMKSFTNGTQIMHDRNTGDLTIHTSGKVIINQCDVVVNNGNVDVFDGDVTVHNGDVVADGISLKNHIHSGVSSGPSTTGKPVG